MNFKEYLDFLLYIGTEWKKYNSTIICQYKPLRDPIKNFVEELDNIINTPTEKLTGPQWYSIGRVLAQYFGFGALKYINPKCSNCKECEDHGKDEKSSKKSEENNSPSCYR